MIKNKFFPILLSLLVIFVFFFSRLQNLTSIPVFGDEAIYIRWAQIIQSEETLRFVPQSDGKQPLFMWLNALSLKFISDPLIAGRTVSVFAGFGCLLFLFLSTAIILNFSESSKNPLKFIKKSISQKFYPSIFTSFIYCLIPFVFFFDRMALADALLSFWGITSFFFSILLAKYHRLDLSLILGIVLGLAWLTKSPAIYFICLSFLTFTIFNFRQIKLFIFPLISVFISFVIYNILRLGPQFSQIAIRNRDYVWSISEILKHPFDPLWPHLGNVISLYQQYISWPVLLLAFLGLFFVFRKKILTNNLLIVTTIWWILPLIANATLAKVFTARYILFTLPPLILLISIGLFYFLRSFKNFLKIIFFIGVFALNVIFIYRLSINPFNQNLTSTETGYLSDWTSGWGIKETADYLKQRSLVANVIVGTEGNFGTLPDGLQIYTNKVHQLTVVGLGLGFTQIPSNLINAKNYGDEVYILINRSRFKINSEDQAKMKLIKSFIKPGQDELVLYQL